ncbi:MAG TPA: type II secretion system F family protein [Jiangellaceae bacterium]|nr:type II secretion system F family protein [Jiangellaceae bacterium]
MTLIMIAGAVAGLGVLVLLLVLAPPKASPAAALVRLDEDRARLRRGEMTSQAVRTGGRRQQLTALGARVRDLLRSLGLELGGLHSDLNILGRTLEQHLATSVLVGVGGFFLPVVLGVVVTFGVPGLSGVLAGVVFGLLGLLLPTILVRGEAEDKRRDFRHVVGSFLDLVAMNLAGGRGVPEALQAAADVSSSWAMVRIRDALLTARLHGVTPWAALGELGDELRIDELRDLGAALALVAEDGAKVRESLAARATSMRRRELAEAEGKAGERSQSMLVAQLLLAVGFLIFLIYPAVISIFSGDGPM